MAVDQQPTISTAAQALASTGVNTSCDYWKVWRTAEYLEQHGISMSKTTLTAERDDPIMSHQRNDAVKNANEIESGSYHEITVAVVDILRVWGHRWAGDPKWQSFLNKSRLLEEAEECIVALHHLLEWRKQQQQRRRQQKEQESVNLWIAVDVCCGKGLFAMFLSYFTSYFQNEFQGLQRIILLDKATIDYHHIHVANSTCQQDGRPFLELWKNCNLHDYDALLDRFQSFSCPVALTGIHLCNMLSPACLGLANGLGPQACPYLCLAPCCLPRLARINKSHPPAPDSNVAVDENQKLNKNQNSKDGSYMSVLAINCFETTEERDKRRLLHQQREDARRRRKKCIQNRSDAVEPKISTVKSSVSSSPIPCWKCGQMGHFKAQCPSLQTSSRPPRVVPPTQQITVDHVWQSPRPFESYCHILAQTLQHPVCLQIVKAGIGKKGEDDASSNQVKHDNDTKAANSQHSKHGNWNAHRKNIFIVASR